MYFNRPFPGCFKSLFKNEAKCKAIDMKNDLFVFTANETDYHKKGFALSLVLKGQLFPSIASMFEKFKRNLSLSRFFEMEFLWLEIWLKLDNLDVRLLSGENQALLK